MVRLKISALSQSHWYEYVMRFGLGGLATVLAGIIADNWGPEIGGLFLAFPAIFCASSTMIEKHERQRKEQHQLKGQRRGTGAAALDASGAVLGSLGLTAFATVVWFAASRFGVLVLPVAAIVWFLISVTMWRAQRALPRYRSSASKRH
jgi:uncharacterized protein DUF3147